MTPTPEPTSEVDALHRAWANRRDLGEYAGVPFEDLLAAHDAQVAEKAWDEGCSDGHACTGTEMGAHCGITNPYREGGQR